ncbi:hypothetical protein TCAP_00578 [Tolypocladium capitatum]|uniref:Uncharacterized protein n=1 Tax=Tolypocladium capitatum TaxID=45235 RepID=A0A2K3QPR8_9HYPO|nr:hypothetical protein TCAP_00578 [Tolypocladium capitatum]
MAAVASAAAGRIDPMLNLVGVVARGDEPGPGQRANEERLRNACGSIAARVYTGSPEVFRKRPVFSQTFGQGSLYPLDVRDRRGSSHRLEAALRALQAWNVNTSGGPAIEPSSCQSNQLPGAPEQAKRAVEGQTTPTPAGQAKRDSAVRRAFCAVMDVYSSLPCYVRGLGLFIPLLGFLVVVVVGAVVVVQVTSLDGSKPKGTDERHQKEL